MIALCIICILFGLGGVGYAVWTRLSVTKVDPHLIAENEKLTELNESLHATRKSLEAQNDLLTKSNKEISQKYEENCEKVNNSYEELNQLTQQKLVLIEEIQIQQITKAQQEAQIVTLRGAIDEVSGNLKSTARASFEQYCDTLDYEYQQKEAEFDADVANLDQLYENQHDAFLRQVSQNDARARAQQEQLERDLDVIRGELEKIRSTRAAAMDAQLREQEIKEKATFYTLQLNEADKRDVAYLQSIEYNLREARPLRMLIWSTFYRDKVNDLAARVGAVGASGIYKITHIDSGISYIGQAKDIKERWVSHVKCSLGIDTPVTSQLYAFTREKGIDNFTFEVLEKCSINELNEKEKFYIDLYQTYDFGLNKTRGNG